MSNVFALLLDDALLNICAVTEVVLFSIAAFKTMTFHERPYISRISPGAPLRPTGTNFGLRVCLVDVINCAKFYRNRLRGLDSVRGRNLTIPIGLRCRR